jgi:hypothetical protein
LDVVGKAGCLLVGLFVVGLDVGDSVSLLVGLFVVVSGCNVPGLADGFAATGLPLGLSVGVAVVGD